MDGSSERNHGRDEGTRSSERKGSTRQRGESSNAREGSATPGRASQDSRRRRGNDQRFAGWGDGIERALCSRAAHFLPMTFPVESHPGAATVAPAVVARRPDLLLLCTFSHHGPHAWPDGELVDDDPTSTTARAEES